MPLPMPAAAEGARSNQEIIEWRDDETDLSHSLTVERNDANADIIHIWLTRGGLHQGEISVPSAIARRLSAALAKVA